MVFNSLSYLLFLVFSVFIYNTFDSNRYRVFILLISSIIFYCAWSYSYLWVILLSIFLDFTVAKYFFNLKYKRFYFVFSILVSLSLLIFYKYSFFILTQFDIILNLFNYKLNFKYQQLILPLAISFYTFETISYIVDVYYKKIKAESNFLNYSLFILFFPKLIAGPILRASELLSQIKFNRRATFNDIFNGFKRITIGLFIKVCLADPIAELVDIGFSQNTDFLSAIDIFTLAFMFGLQIYFDFSAYSSIAIGSARLFGFIVTENFNFPYSSLSPKEFWTRWHISLSTWVKDYIYIPLVSIDRSQKLFYSLLILLLTWTTMGFWHGAKYTFIFWGIYHAIYIFTYRRVIKYIKIKNSSLMRLLYWTLNINLIMLSWIFFRADNLSIAFSMYSKIFYLSNYSWLGMRENFYLITALLFFATVVANFSTYIKSFIAESYDYKFLDALLFGFLIFGVMIFIRPVNQFIYFQF